MDILMRIFRDTVVSIESAVNLVVIKTLSGSASAAAEVVDSMHYNGVLGTLAGDNTIFRRYNQRASCGRNCGAVF